MLFSKTKNDAAKPAIVVASADDALVAALSNVIDKNSTVRLTRVSGDFAAAWQQIEPAAASVIVVDIDAARQDHLAALQTLMQRIGHQPPVIVVTNDFDDSVARWLLRLKVADFVRKPLDPIELIGTCVTALRSQNRDTPHEAQIHAFLPAAGGVGVTTLAIEAAFLLHGRNPKNQDSTVLVDLNFQNGSCADYLDLEARLHLNEVEQRPERLDRQLLEVMISRHASGLSVIAAPSRPTEMRSFDSEIVTRLLDLVSTHFENVVIDMPRTWFPWTDSVILGSNHLYVVTETTVPGLRHARRLLDAIRDRLGDAQNPRVIVNRFEQRLFQAGIRRSDIERALGPAFGCAIANDYRLVREAIDRGVPLKEIKPRNSLSTELRKLLFASPAKAAAPRTQAAIGGLATEAR